VSVRVLALVGVSRLAEPVGAAARLVRVPAGVAVSQLAEPAARLVRVPAQFAEPAGAAEQVLVPASGRLPPTLPALPPQ
jgi:hypothetical protein